MSSINLMILEKHLELQDRHVQRFCLTWSLYTNTADTLNDQRGGHCELPVFTCVCIYIYIYVYVYNHIPIYWRLFVLYFNSKWGELSWFICLCVSSRSPGLEFFPQVMSFLSSGCLPSLLGQG